MDESLENIPPPHCGGPQHLEPNSLGVSEAFGSSTPAQYKSNGGVKSTSWPPCLLPALTPVSKFLHLNRKVLTDVNSPGFVSIKDEIFPDFSFDISTMDKSAVFNQDSCFDLENSSVSSVDTMGNATEDSVKLTNQTTTGPINNSIDFHPPGPSKCNNVTTDADPTGKMVALNKTLDAEADPAELAVSEAEPCSNTIESKCDNVTADADPTGKMVALNETLDASALSTNDLLESHMSVNQLNPQNTFDVDSSVSSVDTMGNATEDSVKLTNQTTTGPINNSIDFHPPGPSKCNNVTADADPTGKMVALNKTLDAEADPAELAVSEAEPCSNTIESKCDNVTADADPTGKMVALNKTLDASALITNSLLESHMSVNQLNSQNTFDVDCSNLELNNKTTTSPMRVDPDPHNTFDMDRSTNLSNHQTTTSLINVNQQNTFDVDSPENETFDVHLPVPSRCTKDTTVDADEVPEDEPVVAVSEDEAVLAVSEDKAVVAVSEDEPVVAVSEDEPVVAVSKDEPVVAVSEDEPVVAVSEDEPVVAVSEDEPVVAVSEDEPVVAVSEDEPVVAVSEDEPVVAVSEDEPVVAVSEDEPVVEVSEDQPVVAVPDDEPVVAVSEDVPGLVAVTEDEPVVTAVSATSSGSASVTGTGNGKDYSQSSTLTMSDIADSPAVNFTPGASKLDDTLELREQAQFTSTPMPHRYAAENVEENPTVVPRKLYQSHSQFVPATNSVESQFVPATNSVESHSQFVPPTNIVSDRKTFLNPNDPRVKHLLPPSASMIPGGNSKKPSGLPMMRRAQAIGPGRAAALPKEATGIPRSVTEVKGIPKAMVTHSADTVSPAVGAALPAAGLRKRHGAGLPLATQRAGPALRPPMTRRLAAKVSGEQTEKLHTKNISTVHTNAAPAVPLLKIGPSPKRMNLRSGGDSSGEAALLAKRKMDVQVPSSSAAGPSQTVKTGQSQTLKRPGSRLAFPGAKQKKMDCATDCANCAELQKQLEEAQQENKRLQDLLPPK